MSDKQEKKRIGFYHAWNGLTVAIKNEKNLRIQLIIAFIVILASLYVRLSTIEWALILTVIHLVIILELINSAIERIIDYVKPDIHPTAKVIKDMAAATVVVAAFLSVLIGSIIIVPKLIHIVM